MSIYVIDINDTITLRNDVDPQKTPEVVRNQLIAQNTYLKNRKRTISLENHIKSKIYKKEHQRQTYQDLPNYAKKMLSDDLISQESYDGIEYLKERYEAEIKSVERDSDGIFTSLFNLINYINQRDSEAIIILESFGTEIPVVLNALKKAYPELHVNQHIGIFNEEGELEYQDEILSTPKQMLDILIPKSIMGWRTNYLAWRGGKMGKPLFYKDTPSGYLKTYFFDDNADICATIFYNEKALNNVEGYRFAKPYIFKVDTAQALIDPYYFTNLLKNQFSVLSYNIQLSGLDVPGHEWKIRVNPVCKIIHQHPVVLLQELSHEQLIDLQNNVPYSFVSINTVTGHDLLEPAPDTQEGLSIAFNPTVFDFLEKRYTWLSDTPDIPSQQWGEWETSFPKLIQKVTLIHKETGSKIAFYNSHFCHEEDPKNQINPRLESAKIELNQISDDLKKGCLVVSCGDRNTHLPRDQSVLDLYHQTPELEDVEPYNEGLKTTFLGYQGHPRINPITEEGFFEKNMNLDRMFFSKQGLSLIHTNVRSGLYNDNGELVDISSSFDIETKALEQERQFASDHAPIMSTFKIKP